MTALLELGDRYWALGLPAAARSALTRAMAATTDVAPALRLTEIALAQGDAKRAVELAAEAAKRAPGPATKILLGRAQLAAGELAAARMSLLVAIDAPKLAAWDRPRVHLELSRVAHGQGDPAGAAAQAAAGFDAMVQAASVATGGIESPGGAGGRSDAERRGGWIESPGAGARSDAERRGGWIESPGGAGARSDAERRGGWIDLTLIEELCAAVVAHGRAGDAMATVEAAGGKGATALCRASLLVGRQAAGDGAVSDAQIDAALDAVTPEGVSGVAIRLRRLERRVRKHAGDAASLLAELDELIGIAAGEALPAVDRARLWFLYAAICADDPNKRDRAEDAYRKGLAFQPGHTSAACRLALLMLDRGDQAGALAEIERALRIDASHGLAWRNAARMLDATSPSLGVIVGRLLDAANPGAGSAAGGVAPRLVTATAEVARHDVLAGVYAHGHRVKNLLGIIGARARSARKSLAQRASASERAEADVAGDGDLHERLKDLESDVTALYEEWAQYLRSMQAPTPTVELVTLAPLLHEVVVAAQARTQHVPIALETAAGLPDVRGDRMLLREALLNVISNAAEACAPAGGEVSVRVRAIAAPGGGTAPIVEIVVADTGPGIPRAHLGRLFVPGFTTKETGSGVGLAIAERVVAAHHGRITVESEEGRGTTISITLPTDKTGLSSLPLWSIAER